GPDPVHLAPVVHLRRPARRDHRRRLLPRDAPPLPERSGRRSVPRPAAAPTGDPRPDVEARARDPRHRRPHAGRLDDRSAAPVATALLLLSLPLVPVATAVHISPWLGAVAILALGLSWHIPAQSPEYLVAYGATHGRLYSYAQGRRMALAYEAIALAALALSLPYLPL